MPIDLYMTKLSPPCRAVLMLLRQFKLEVNQKILHLKSGLTEPSTLTSRITHRSKKPPSVTHQNWIILSNGCAIVFQVIPLYKGTEVTEQQLTNFKNNLKLLDTLIGSNKYVAGNDLTIADFSVLASTSVLEIKDFKDLDEYPNVKRWFDGLRKELPYYEEVNRGLAHMFRQKLANK